MEQLLKLKNSIIEYLSPVKRRHTVLIATPSPNQSPMQRPVQPMTEPRILKGKAVIAGRVSKKHLFHSHIKRSTRKLRSTTNSDDEFADDLKDDQASVATVSHADITPDDSSSQINAPDDEKSFKSVSVEEEENNVEDLELASEDESELDAEAKVHEYLDRQTEIARHREALERINDGEWHEDEAALFMKLTMRGYEPLIPAHWSFDFRTCPQVVFSSNIEETLINAKSGSEFRGTNALQSLITLGGRVRALLECHKPPEQVIRKEFENYIKWSEKDGGYDSKRFIPLLCLVAGHQNQDLSAISKSITDQMEFLAHRHRQALFLTPQEGLSEDGEVEMFSSPPPVIYGVIIARCVAVFLTLDSGNREAKPKTIAHFDFSDKDMDVWNGFAVAILVCIVRNQLMASVGEMETETEELDSDPDL